MKHVKLFEEFTSSVNEKDITTPEQFTEYAMTVLKKAHGEDFDEKKANAAIEGILKKCGEDFGACIGMLTASLGN